MELKIINKKLSILEVFTSNISNLFGAISAVFIILICSPFIFITKLFRPSKTVSTNQPGIQLEEHWRTIIENHSIKIYLSIIDDCSFKLKSEPPIKELEQFEFTNIIGYDIDRAYVEFHNGLYLLVAENETDDVILYHLNIDNRDFKQIHLSTSLISKFIIYPEINRIDFDFIDYQKKTKQIISIKK